MLARLARAGPALLALQPLTVRVLPKAKVAAIGISTFAAYSASTALCTPVAEYDDIDTAIAECINDAISPRAQRARDREQREHEDSDDSDDNDNVAAEALEINDKVHSDLFTNEACIKGPESKL